MGHGSGPAAAVDQQGCRVLPVIEEEPEPEQAEGEGLPEEMTRLAERRKAIVARMRELLSRAAAAQSAHHKLRRSTVATAKKWKVLWLFLLLHITSRLQTETEFVASCTCLLIKS